MSTLAKEFRHEPGSGLVAGIKGMDVVVKILKQARQYLSDHGILVVEVGYSMQALIDLLPEVNFTWLEFEHGGDGVFLLTASQLDEYQSMFDAL